MLEYSLKGTLLKNLIHCVMPSAGPEGAEHDTRILSLNQ